MNKGQLVAEVSKKTGLSRKDTTNVINVTIETIKKNVKKSVTLIWFGTSKVVRRRIQTGRYPQT